MKKIFLLLGVLIITACTDKAVSTEYYKAHISEANDEVFKCAMDKNENSVNCSNALTAVQMAKSKADDMKTINNFK
jgi:hypothetical protein